jgi:hypothetical protein
MGVSKVGAAGAPGQSRRDWLRPGLAGFAVGAGLCAALGAVLAVRGWNQQRPDRAQIGNQHILAPMPVTVAAPHSRSAQVGLPAIPETKPDKKRTDPASDASSPLAHATADKKGPAAVEQSHRVTDAAPETGRSVSERTARFTLSAPPVAIPASFVLPNAPWFALADLTTDEPESSQGTEAVCAVNRSLNTALTWAKSPEEAATQAEHEGKLVFLIHVSGNFENPGFT